ncbi:MAG: CDP-diacylglycerol--glycerol-3-phosphate 3-phosphatidyltransferase [Arsenophonus sp.]|nr:MAG: CDP-diacylglycerol--glycerol-3-phosphate 3-phosphatidyltransferase [Arsenophonus sp.]
MQLNLSTYLTILRLILTPFLIIFFYIPFRWSPIVCSLLFTTAALTDLFDGFFARLLKQKTKFGSFLDPVADKIIVNITLVLITEYYSIWWMTIPTIIIISREIFISALREWIATELNKKNIISVSYIGKSKTTFQMISLIGLLWHPNNIIEKISIALLYFSTILAFLSMLQYTFSGIKYTKNKIKYLK